MSGDGSGTKRLSIGVVRFLGLGLMVGIIAAGSILGYLQVSSMEGDLRRMTGVHWQELRGVDDLFIRFVSVRGSLTDLVIEEREDVTPILLEVKSLIEDSTTVSASMTDEGDRASLEAFVDRLKKYRAAMVAYSQELQIRRTGEGVRSWERTLLNVEKEAHDLIGELKARIQERSRLFEAEVLKRSALTRRWIIAIGVLGFIFGLAVLVLLQRSLARPIGDLVDVTESLAAGDLTADITARANDDIGTLTLAIAGMMRNLRAIVGEIKNTVLNVADAARGVEHHTGEVSRKVVEQNEVVERAHGSVRKLDHLVAEINEQFGRLALGLEESSSSVLELKSSVDEVSTFADGLADEVETITSSLIEMNATVGETADLLNSLSSASQQTAQTARSLAESSESVGDHARASTEIAEKVTNMAKEEGSQALRNMIQVTRSNKELVDDYGEMIRSLGERSASIGEVLDVIKDMADQTGLLALNAAIIAAQAGEHGKSFAVVAEEVGSLASTTASSVQRVEQVIRTVRKDVENAIQMVDKVADGAQQGISSAERAGEVFREIEEISSHSAGRAREITEASQQQIVRSEEILQVVTRNMQEVVKIQQSVVDQKKGGDLIVSAAEKIRETAMKLKQSTHEQARESGVISKALTDTNQFSRTIKEAMDRENEVSREIVGSLVRITESASDIDEYLGALKGLVRDLSSLAENLRPVVDRFRLPEGRGAGTHIPAVMKKEG